MREDVTNSRKVLETSGANWNELAIAIAADIEARKDCLKIYLESTEYPESSIIAKIMEISFGDNNGPDYVKYGANSGDMIHITLSGGDARVEKS